jgi:O-methyltransferase
VTVQYNLEMTGRIAPKKLIAALLFPKYSVLVDKLNWNARWRATKKEAGDIPVFQTREELHRFVQSRPAGPVDYLEFGVWRGESLRWWCDGNTDQESRFWGFDSFQGLPEDWCPGFPKGAFSTAGTLPDIRDPRVQFLVGWFQDTLPPFLESYQTRQRSLIIHCDCDLYSSSLFCLTALNRIIKPGGIVIFDDLGDVMTEYPALTHYAAAYQRKWRIIAATEGFLQAAVEFTE